MSREEFFKLLTQTQKTLESKLGQEKKGSSSEVMGKSGTIPSLFDISVPMPMELLHNKDGEFIIFCFVIEEFSILIYINHFRLIVNICAVFRQSKER